MLRLYLRLGFWAGVSVAGIAAYFYFGSML
jgi:hypothetical protein